MGEMNDMDKQDEVMLPGFRFHPTDEELVGFYLKKKIQQRPLSIELIKQLDIYKYDPWDLPKLATTGEKEWYFYCPRDRKYRNSARPNRVTGAGFWKATGTDRPIYSSEGTKCIGLKKSLVFYKGRAAKGIKTDWMMHEFRLPSLVDSSIPKRHLDKNIPANDLWAICRIFKKTNTMAHRAISHCWTPALPENSESDIFSVSQISNGNQYGSENISCTTTEAGTIQFGYSNCLQQQQQQQQQQGLDVAYPSLDVASYRPCLPISGAEISTNFMFNPAEISMPSKCTVDLASMLLNLSPVILGDVNKTTDFGQPLHGTTVDFPIDMSAHSGSGVEDLSARRAADICIINNNSNIWGNSRAVNFPFNLSSNFTDEWKQALPWDSPPCPSEICTSYPTSECYT